MQGGVPARKRTRSRRRPGAYTEPCIYSMTIFAAPAKCQINGRAALSGPGISTLLDQKEKFFLSAISNILFRKV